MVRDGVNVMKKRYKMSKYKSGKVFKKNSRVNKMNTRPRPMRGGTRL